MHAWCRNAPFWLQQTQNACRQQDSSQRRKTTPTARAGANLPSRGDEGPACRGRMNIFCNFLRALQTHCNACQHSGVFGPKCLHQLRKHDHGRTTCSLVGACTAEPLSNQTRPFAPICNTVHQCLLCMHNPRAQRPLQHGAALCTGPACCALQRGPAQTRHAVRVMRTRSAQHCGRKRRRKYCKQHKARA